MSVMQNAQMQMVNPVMSKYGTEMGMNMNMAGMLVGILSFAAMMTRPIGGGIADRLNNRLAAAVSSAVMGFSALGYMTAGESIPLLMCIRFFHGAAFGIGGTILMRMAGMLIPAERMGEGMGYFALGQVLPMTAAPALSIFLSDKFGFKWVFIIAAAAAFLAAISALWVKLPRNARGGNEKSPQGKKIPKETLIFAIVAAAVTFCQSQETAYIVLYGEELGISNMGIYFTVSAAALFAVRAFLGKLIDSKSLKTILIPSMICITAAMAVLAAVSQAFGKTWIFILFMAASGIKSIGQAMAQPALQSASVNAVSKDRRGTASAVYYMGCDFGQTIGPLAGGFAAGHLGYRWAYLLSAIVAAAGLLGFLAAGKKKNQ